MTSTPSYESHLPEDKRHWLKIKSTNPATPHTYNVGEWVKAKVEYNNPGPNGVRIWVNGYKNGVIANTWSNGSPLHAPGTGEMEGVFAVRGTGDIDAVRVTMTDDVTKQTLVVTTVPVRMEWKRNEGAFEVELISVKPPGTLSPAKEIGVPAKAGQKFTLDLTVRYKTPMPTKLASNLLLREANILPPELIKELSANHATTWHFDTQSRSGYSAVNGEGQITFDLTGYAPPQKGEHSFDINLGLFDANTWETIKIIVYKVTLDVSD